jgi:hypothetical protein
MARRWTTNNPIRYREIIDKHRAYKRLLKASVESFVSEEERVDTLAGQRKTFLLDLFEVCHQLYLEGSTLNQRILVRRDDWTRVTYANKTVGIASANRAWERWKGKIRKLGCHDGEHTEEEDRSVALLLNLNLVTRAVDKALGIDESLPLE